MWVHTRYDSIVVFPFFDISRKSVVRYTANCDPAFSHDITYHIFAPERTPESMITNSTWRNFSKSANQLFFCTTYIQQRCNAYKLFNSRKHAERCSSVAVAVAGWTVTNECSFRGIRTYYFYYLYTTYIGDIVCTETEVASMSERTVSSSGVTAGRGWQLGVDSFAEIACASAGLAANSQTPLFVYDGPS